MNTASAVIYLIDGKHVRKVERAIEREDGAAYREHGPYFQHHRGKHYLVNGGDVGRRVRALLATIADCLGGIEMSGSPEELQGYTDLLDSDDCYSCFLGDRLLLVPKPQALTCFVRWMQQWATGAQSTGDALLRQALWEIGTRFNLHVLGTPEEGFTQIATPFLLPDNDTVDLYVCRKGEIILLTDLGETLAWLRLQQADPHLPEAVLSWVADICSSLGIEQDRGMLMIRVAASAASEKLTDSLLRLAQGIVRIASLQALLREHRAASVNKEDTPPYL